MFPTTIAKEPNSRGGKTCNGGRKGDRQFEGIRMH